MVNREPKWKDESDCWFQQYYNEFSDIVCKYFKLWKPDIGLFDYYLRMCRGEIVANVPCFSSLSECLRLLVHLQKSGSGKFALTYASIKGEYDVALIEALKEGVLRRLDKLVNRSVKNVDGVSVTEYTFNQDGLDEYAWYVDDGGNIANQDVWSDQALDELAKCCKAWEDEERKLIGREGKRILVLGLYAYNMFAYFPKTASKKNKHLCIYDIMRNSGFLDFCPASRLSKMDNEDEVDRANEVRDWIRAFETFVQGEKSSKKG